MLKKLGNKNKNFRRSSTLNISCLLAVGRMQISLIKLFRNSGFMSVDASEFQKFAPTIEDSVHYDRIRHKKTNVRRRLTLIF